MRKGMVKHTIFSIYNNRRCLRTKLESTRQWFCLFFLTYTNKYKAPKRQEWQIIGTSNKKDFWSLLNVILPTQIRFFWHFEKTHGLENLELKDKLKFSANVFRKCLRVKVKSRSFHEEKDKRKLRCRPYLARATRPLHTVLLWKSSLSVCPACSSWLPWAPWSWSSCMRAWGIRWRMASPNRLPMARAMRN